MRTFLCYAALACAMAWTAAEAQSSTSGYPSSVTGNVTSNHMSGALSQEQFQKLGDYADQAKRLTKEDKAKGKTLETLLAEDKAKASELVKALPLSCEVADAMLTAEGPADVDGQKLDTHTYEVACTNGMGYFLVAADGGKTYGFSCLTAEATRKADVAAKRQPGTTCKLGANVIPESMASNIMSHMGFSCMVKDIKSVGVNSKSKIEYNEVACADGKGYLLMTAVPGLYKAPAAINCHDAAMQGFQCKLTDSGPVVTKLTFVEALKTHKIPCTADVNNLKYYGMQSAKKRYVVEFSCPEQPKGLVAFIPAAGSTAPFETGTCKDAEKQKVTCTLWHP